MILLIGGSSHVGKTYLAQKLLEKYKFPYLSLDHLKMGMIRTNMTELTVNDDFKMRYWLWPIAAEMIKTAIENNQNLIVEGCYIPGEWVQSFTEKYLKHIKCVFIVMSENYLKNNFNEVKSKANIIEHRINDELNLERLIMCSVNFKNDCICNNIPYIEVEKSYNIDDILHQYEKLTDLI